MIKFILALVIGLGLGGLSGFYYATEQSKKEHQAILKMEEENWTQQLKICNEQKLKVEEEVKSLTAELELNSSRPGFVTSRKLEAPLFSPANLEPLSSNKRGDIVLNWEPVKGAKEYIVTIEDESGTVISTVNVEGETSIYLNRVTRAKKLPEAQYFVRIASVNGLDQTGDPSDRKPIIFGKQSFHTSKKSKSSHKKNRK